MEPSEAGESGAHRSSLVVPVSLLTAARVRSRVDDLLLILQLLSTACPSDDKFLRPI